MFGDTARAERAALTATLVALIGAGAWISIPFVPVPLTLQTFFVLLSGVLLAGLGVLLGPTGGFIVGFVLAGLVAGFAYERRERPVRMAGLALGGLAVYLCGAGWLVLSAGTALPAALAVGALPFIPGDALKTAADFAKEKLA